MLGVTKNVAKMWEEYAKKIGKTTNDLTQYEKIQAEVNGILEETKFQANDASIYANTFSGKVAQLNTAFKNMKVAIGNVIQPIAKLFVPIITNAVNAVTKLFTAVAGLFSLFGLKADSVETVSNGISDMALGASNVSDEIKNIGNSAKKTAKDLKSLASFDTAQVLRSNNSSSDNGSGSNNADVGGLDGLSNSLNVSSVLEEDSSAFDLIIEKARKLTDIFKKGFDSGFGNINFGGILDHLQGIKMNLIDIWTDSTVLESIKNWGKVVIYTLGQITGSVARIGINIGEGLVGSLDKYLAQNNGRIKKFISNMFDISSEEATITGNFFQALGKISDAFKGPTAKQIGADIIAIFTNPFMSVMKYWAKLGRDIKNILFQPIINNAKKIKKVFENMLKVIQKVTGTLSRGLTYMGDKFDEVYDNRIKPFMDSLRDGLSDTFGKFLDVYNEYVVPFLNNVATGIEKLWNGHFKPLINKLADFCGSVADLIKTLWETVLKPLIDWCIENIIPVLVPIFTTIWNTIKNTFGIIANIIGGIIDTFRGLIDFIVGVFTGNWDKAWEGIKTMFTGKWNAMKASVEYIWNRIKGIIELAINIVLGKIKVGLTAIKTVWENIWNGIKNFVGNVWQGIKNVFSGVGQWFSNKFQEAYNGITRVFNNIGNFFSGVWDRIRNTFSALGTSIGNAISNSVKSGINTVISLIERTINKAIDSINGAIGVINLIPGVNVSKIRQLSIPRLAEGAYVKANTPQLAMIGDNKRHGEIVAPEDKLEAIYRKVNKESGVGSNQKVIDLLEMIIQILKNLDFDFNLDIDGYELNTQLEKVKNKNRFATNGG